MPLPKRGLRDKVLAIVAVLVPFPVIGYVLKDVQPSFAVLAPLLFLVLGSVVFFLLPPRSGFLPLLFFHVLLSSYWALLPSAGPFFLRATLACAVPAVMAHFTLAFFDLPLGRLMSRVCVTASYAAAAALFWICFRFQTDLYAVLLWMALLLVWAVGGIRVLVVPHSEFDQVFSRSLLLGIAAGLIIPFGALLADRTGYPLLSFPVASLLLPLFPTALLVGILPKRQEERELYLVQSEKRASMGNVLSGLAHEINNPLTYIYSNMEPLRESLDYLKEHLPNADAKTAAVLKDLDQLARTMDEGVTRAKSLVEKFRYHPSGQPERREGVDLNKLIGQSVDLLSHKWSGRLRVERRFEELPAVMGSATELGQVFTNVIANACDATPEGGSVTVSTYRGAASVKVSVRDTGKGIPKSEIRRIFDPFYSTKRQGEGMGLGLAITMQIVKNHGGSIEVRSEVGKGTEFLVILPYS